MFNVYNSDTRHRNHNDNPHHCQTYHRQPPYFNRHSYNDNYHSPFVVKLLTNHCHRNNNDRKKSSVETITSQCNPKPYKYRMTAGYIAARLFFNHQSDAVAAVVFLWERRLAGYHLFTPVTDFCANEWELNERIKDLFKLHVEKVLEGEVVKKLQRRVGALAVEIDKLTSYLRRPLGFRVSCENRVKKEALRVEMEGIVRRMEEFKKGMNCLVEAIEGKETGEMGVLRVRGDGRKLGSFDYWSRVHFLILRECRRVEDGLPIYGFRSDILTMLYSQQVCSSI